MVTCERAKNGSGSITQTCKVKKGSAPIKFAAAGLKFAANISRAGVTYGVGFAIGSAGGTQLVLRPLRKLGRGRYTLTIKRGRKLTHETIAIG